MDFSGLSESATVQVRVARDGTNDTSTSDAQLYMFDIHIQIDDLGSQMEYGD